MVRAVDLWTNGRRGWGWSGDKVGKTLWWVGTVCGRVNVIREWLGVATSMCTNFPPLVHKTIHTLAGVESLLNK